MSIVSSKSSWRTAAVLSFFVAGMLVAVTAVSPDRAFAKMSAPTCEALFLKEKFFSPSIQITANGTIETKLTNSESAIGRILNSLTRALYKPLSMDKIERVTQRLAADTREIPFWEKLSDAFGLEIQIDPQALARIPRTGGLIFVLNHTANGPEGIAGAAIISKVRPDLKLIMTPLLEQVPNMRDNAFFIKPNLSDEARAFNVTGLEAAAQWVKNGGALGVFPTGEIAGKSKFFSRQVQEGRWRKGVAHILAQAPDAHVLPMFVEGQASDAYLSVWYFTKKIPYRHEQWQTNINAGFHVREIGNRVGSEFRFTIGEPISSAEIDRWKNPARRADSQVVMNELRRRTHALKDRTTSRVNLRTIPRLPPVEKKPIRRIDPIAPQGDMSIVRAELRSRARVIVDMDPENETKRMKVYIAKGYDIPETMKELGRLREITFREVGEGSGRSRDLDGFDEYYEHLIVLDKKTGYIAGAYRLGRVDEITKALGQNGLYTSLFFDHKKIVDTYLQNALELGRSFVVPEYQRSIALLALFSAIGRFVVENPKYKYLMGPVSISSEVTDRSQGLMVAYLKRFHESPDADFVRALTPLKKDFVLSAEDLAFLDSSPTMDALKKRVEEIEKEAGTGNKVPPLIPIYVGLGARFFKFNIDADFNTLDGLIVTDLSKLTVEILKPYMGEEGARAFLEWQARNPSP